MFSFDWAKVCKYGKKHGIICETTYGSILIY